ncbi:MAG TPA: FAD-dependent oxidoreductase [Myxococcota bacterium]|nr:FAD-dependent oxidoreductase [Myxococcota bacterium]
MNVSPGFSYERLEDQFAMKEPLNEAQAIAEAHRCLNCFLAPCVQACPTSINIPQFINRIATKNTLGAAKTILDANVFGLSCALSCPTEVLCEGACVYHALHEPPLMIGKLQAYAVLHAYEQKHEFFKPAKKTNKKIALIGAGPASLACAHELRRYGHKTIIYEKGSVPGGLNTSGIAPYKMKADLSLKEIEEILRMGVSIRYGQELGRNLSLDQLLLEHDAVFLGMGLSEEKFLGLASIKHPRILGAVSLIEEIKTAPAHNLAWLKDVKKVLIIGGGNTAIDACRELKILGIPEVVLCYRRDEHNMSGYAHEFKHALLEKVSFLFNTVPTEFKAINSQSLSVKLNQTTMSDNELKILNQSITEIYDLVLFAIGQNPLASVFSNLGIVLKNGRLKTDENGRTTHPKIFAGGDVANGGKEVVNAVYEGKCAAQAIHQDLTHG